MLVSKVLNLTIATAVVFWMANLAATAQAKSESSDLGTSIIVEIQESTLEVRSVITDQLIPSIQQLSDGLKRDYQKAIGQQQQWHKTGNNDYALSCEETIAEALSDAVQNLGNICDLEQSVSEACGALREDLQAGLTEFRSRRDHHRGKAVAHKEEADRVSATMDSLVQRFRENIATGAELPLEMDTLVRRLDQSLTLAQNRHKIAEDAEKALEQWLARCVGFSEVLDRMGADYALVFEAARAHVSLLGDVAIVSIDIRNIRSLARGLGSFSGELLAAQSGFEDITSGLQNLFAISPEMLGGNEAMEALNVESDRGLKILSKWKKKGSL